MICVYVIKNNARAGDLGAVVSHNDIFNINIWEEVWCLDWLVSACVTGSYEQNNSKTGTSFQDRLMTFSKINHFSFFDIFIFLLITCVLSSFDFFFLNKINCFSFLLFRMAKSCSG